MSTLTSSFASAEGIFEVSREQWPKAEGKRETISAAVTTKKTSLKSEVLGFDAGLTAAAGCRRRRILFVV